MVKAIAYRVVPARVRQALRRRLMRGSNIGHDMSVSSCPEIIMDEIPSELLQGWKNPAVALKQQKAFVPLLRKMYEGKPREDFVVLAAALDMVGLKDPLIIEVGCGSGWNSEVLAYLLKRPINYIGLDYSESMIDLGKRCYPDAKFLVGEATALPLKDDACDIFISGTVLMHLLFYRDAIRESRRVARKWCILHTVPIVRNCPTKILRKFAYDVSVIEVIFNEEELHQLLEQVGLEVRYVFNSIPYNLMAVLEKPTVTKTYLCEVR